MVRARMENSDLSGTPELLDSLSDAGRTQLSSEPGEHMRIQDLLAFSEAHQAENMAPPSSLRLLQDRLVGKRFRAEVSSEKSSSVLPHFEELHSVSESLDVSESYEQPLELLKNLRSQDKCSSDSAQALFWAGILQAQMCVLDLQGEIDKQKEPLKTSTMSIKKMQVTGMSLDSTTTHEPLLPENNSAEEPENLEKQEEEESGEEEEEEEEVECLFFNNPLFQESPHLRRTFEGQVPLDHPEREASTEIYTEIFKSGLDSRNGSDLFCQANVSVKSVALNSLPIYEPCDNKDVSPCSFPSYTPHYRSSSPLMITEGDPEGTCSLAESTKGQGCSLDPVHRDVLESVAPGEDPPGSLPAENPPGSLPAEGLLFSAYNTCLMSALLQECPESAPPYKTKSPGEIPSRFQVLSVPIAEHSLQQEIFGSQAPSHGQHSSCRWVGEPERTLCLQKEVAEDVPFISLRGTERKLVNSVEVLKMVELPTVQNDERLEDKEVELTLQGLEELPQESAGPGESLPAAGSTEPNRNLLFANGTSGDQAAACRLATRLFHLDGFKRSQVAAFLQKNNAFSQMVAEAYLSFFHFSGQTLDQALRSFLKALVLTGETQERERILLRFSQRYHCCNPGASLSPDAVHTLACALILLNTDLHGQNIGRSMSCQDFISNLTALNDGKDFPKELLKALYNSIRHEKLEWAMDMEETLGAKVTPSAASTPQKSSPFLTVLHDPEADVFRQGLLARKVHAEADGKKTPWGKRGWKTFHAVLKGTVLYFLKDEKPLEVSGSEELIGVHHALAEKASKYTKRPHVFRLQTADWRVFLFQAPTSEEMTSWISRINLVAAMFSAPPFPAAVGSQKRFSRPILPTVPSKNSLEQQHLAHEACMDRVSHELLELQRNLPDKRGRGRDLEECQLRKEYLLYEKRRYEMYVKVLEVKLGCATEDLEQWEARLEEVEESCPSLQKSHSSPSLNVDGPPLGGGRVKRNISERRTVRRIIPRRNKHLL